MRTGLRRFPRVLEGDVGRAIANLVVERELSFLHELEHREPGKHLRDGPDAEQRVLVRRALCFEIRLAPARDPDGTVAIDERDADRWNALVLDDLFDALLELSECLGCAGGSDSAARATRVIRRSSPRAIVRAIIVRSPLSSM